MLEHSWVLMERNIISRCKKAAKIAWSLPRQSQLHTNALPRDFAHDLRQSAQIMRHSGCRVGVYKQTRFPSSSWSSTLFLYRLLLGAAIKQDSCTVLFVVLCRPLQETGLCPLRRNQPWALPTTAFMFPVALVRRDFCARVVENYFVALVRRSS